MKAISGIRSKHMSLLDEYRMALSLWSETRALYSPEAAEVVQATKHLEDLEQELSLCDVPLEQQPSSESSSARAPSSCRLIVFGEDVRSNIDRVVGYFESSNSERSPEIRLPTPF